MSDEAIQLNDSRVEEGNLLRVYNKQTDKFSNANKVYSVVWTQKAATEIPLMFTDSELTKFSYRAMRNSLPQNYPGDYIIGHLVHILNYVFLPINNEGKLMCLLMTQREAEAAAYRASRNPEDVPQKSFLTDLID